MSHANGLQRETGVPIPPARHGRGTQWPLLSMEIMESVLVPCPKTEAARIQRNISAAICHCTKKSNRTWTTRMVEGGVRVWRLS